MGGNSDEIADLVASARAGDQGAFGQIVDRCAGQVTAVAYSVLGDFGRSEDAGQEAFLEAWGKLEQLKDNTKFLPWVCTIARRRAIDMTRKRIEAPVEDVGDSTADAIWDASQTAEEELATWRERELMWNMVESLPPKYREAMVLYYRSEKSVDDVAVALDASEATIRQRLKRGRDLLRDEAINRLAQQLKASAPTAAFTATILAGIGKGATAAAASGSTAVAGGVALKAGLSTAAGSAKTGIAAAGAASIGALTGPAIGLAGGGLGAWASWKNASYQSQRQFVVRQTIIYFLALLAFGAVSAILYFGVQTDDGGWIPKQTTSVLWVVLLVLFQVWNVVWMVRVIRRDRDIVREAARTNEPLLPGAKAIAGVMKEDSGPLGSPRECTASGWFGGIVGGSLWMLIAATILYVQRSPMAACIVLLSFCVCNAMGALLWRRRSSFSSHAGLRAQCWILGATTTLVFFGIQFIASPAAKAMLQWSPGVWAILLIFPLLYFRSDSSKPHHS